MIRGWLRHHGDEEVVDFGALILGIPLAGTIAAITFLAAYVPYLGAWTAGAFEVLLALGGAGTAGHPPARGPDRDDRGWQPVRRGGADPLRHP